MKTCQRCGALFSPLPHLASKQLFCGSKTKKTGCSRIVALEALKKANKQPDRKRKRNELIKKWRKRQRLINGPDAIRQRAINRKYHAKNKVRIREVNRSWRKKNMPGILFKNKQRELLKKALGTVTWQEWNSIKERYKYRCAICGIREIDLKIKWAGTKFDCLTMDHIRPLSKGGLNVSRNIQPACISCNSAKRDSFIKLKSSNKILHSIGEIHAWRQKQFGTLVVTNGCFDLIHAGHVRYLEHGRSLGSSLLIGVNSDASVRSLKGPTRPINIVRDRMEILSAMECVSAVTCVDSTNMKDFLKLVTPDVWFKGGDYTLQTLDPHEVASAREVGAEIILVPMVEGYSTTITLSRC